MNKGVKNKIPAIEADCIQLFIRSTHLLLIEFLQTQLAELKSFIGCDLPAPCYFCFGKFKTATH